MILPVTGVHLFSLVMGALVGSFLNVVIYRLPREESVVRPRSHCPHCKEPIAAYDNIPLLSYLLLRGKCRHCKTSFSARYPLVEAITAVLFLAVEMKWGFNAVTVFRDWPLMAALVAITFIDFDHRIIPDKISLPGIIYGLAWSYFVPHLGWVQGWVGAALGFSIFYFFSWLYFRSTGKVGLGGGDVKLLALLGAFLGPWGVLTIIFVSSLSGSVLGLAVAALQKKEGGTWLGSSIPFGPFLVLGALYYYLLGDLLWLPFTNPT